jgi:hypothetical protein
MARLTDPNGSVVNVDDDFAKVLVESHGYTSADDSDTKKAPAKKSASSKTND